jgi:PPOX class probable F420-dependent enzyme
MPLPDDVRALFEKPNFVHLATLMPDGGPHTVPVWMGVEGEHLAFFTQPASRKAKNIDRDPRVAVSVVDRDDPYRMAQVRGRVVERRTGEEALAIIDRLSHDYTGKPFPMRTGTVFLIEAERTFDMTLPFEDRPTT